jgi:UDP-N-acetylmuramoylalanine--D-glutamate ligase
LDYYPHFGFGWFGKFEGTITMAILVAGLGLSGQAALRFLSQQGSSLLAFDTRPAFDVSGLEQDFPNVTFAVGHLPNEWLSQLSMLVLSPGIDPNAPWIQALVAKGVALVGEVELFCRALPSEKKVIAITGSNGKSTVTTLVGELLEAQGYAVAVGGNLGTPAVDLLLQQPDADVYVLELSSFQLETTHSLNATSAVVLNISPDHLDRYGEMTSYIAAKAPIYAMTQLAVVNRDDVLAHSLCPNHVPKVGFGVSEPIQAGDAGIIMHHGQDWLAVWQSGQAEPEAWFATADLLLMGRHNWSNCLAALALCLPLGLTREAATRVLKVFTGLSHRAQLVKTVAGVRWVNDSKGTNVGSTLSALSSLGADAPVILLAGGQGKGQDFSDLAAPLSHYARALIVFGEDAQHIARSCNGACDIHHVETMAQAVTLANSLAQAGDVVLLSPACASFDQFRNYGHRGDVFIDCVASLS